MDSQPHPAALAADQLLDQCQILRTRRGGPGGQHRNKVQTAIELTHIPTGISGQAGERRSQAENRKVAIRRLRINLALAMRREISESVTPSQLWQAKCQGMRVGISPKHHDFPSILAEALDFIAGCQFDVVRAAERLECSTSQLVKLLKAELSALELVNRHRQERGLSRLK